jgi:RNA polymerase sigma factor (sigma-70 family)
VSKQYNGQLVADMSQLGKPFCTDDNSRLYPLVTAGDADARRQMIEGNMSLAIAKVESFVRCFPEVAYLRDDLTSAAFVGLTKAVNKMAMRKGPRSAAPSAPTDFIGMWIDRELRELTVSETTIHIPPRSKYRALAKGKELKTPVVQHDIPERFEVPSYQKQLEDRDLLESCCVCDEERTLLAMWLAEHTDAEIAKALGKSRETVRRLRHRLEDRIRRKMEALGDE